MQQGTPSPSKKVKLKATRTPPPKQEKERGEILIIRLQERTFDSLSCNWLNFPLLNIFHLSIQLVSHTVYMSGFSLISLFW